MCTFFIFDIRMQSASFESINFGFVSFLIPVSKMLYFRSDRLFDAKHNNFLNLDSGIEAQDNGK